MKTKLNNAFKELSDAGYFAEQDFWCCQRCGWFAVPEDKVEKVVFYHGQDKEYFTKTGILYLSWAGNGDFICDVMRNNGLDVEWSGCESKRIKVFLKE